MREFEYEGKGKGGLKKEKLKSKALKGGIAFNAQHIIEHVSSKIYD